VLGFFLQYDADTFSSQWPVTASAELRLVHMSEVEKTRVKGKNKRAFKNKEKTIFLKSLVKYLVFVLYKKSSIPFIITIATEVLSHSCR
jgi:hypothetical protein